MNGPDQVAMTLRYQDYNILIVDDTPVNLKVIVDFLERYGFGVRISRNGENALKRVRYDSPDLILLDVLMPGLDGFETCRRLKADTRTEDIPIIFMTSLTSVEDKVRGFEVGAVDYVTKPLHQEEVLARITTHLQLRHLTQSLHEKNQQLQTSNREEKARLFEAVSQQQAQLRALTNKLTAVQEAERKQLARELHDEMGQALTAISINLSAAIAKLDEATPTRVKDRLVEANHLTDQTLEQIREISLNLRPPMLDDLGLLPTLEWYIKRFDRRVNTKTIFNIKGVNARLPANLETDLYRIVQEGLTNIARHAQANHVCLTLLQTSTEIALSIEDDGQGFDVRQVINQDTGFNGMGLLGIRERIVLLGGQFDIQATLGQGTKLSMTIPWEHPL